MSKTNHKQANSTVSPSAEPPQKVKNFAVMSQIDVPHGRNGKHKDIVTQILDDLAQLKDGNAIRIRLDELPDTKEKIRAALSRAVIQRDIQIVTSADDDHLYIWHSSNSLTKGTRQGP